MPDVSKNNSVTLCAIMRDEGRYILEWVAHYRLLGFTNIVVYDNNSAGPFRLELSNMERAGLIRHVVWDNDVLENLYTPEQIERTNPQQLAYEHCQTTLSTEWIAVFDADEFLVLHKDADIFAFLARLGPEVGAVHINWRIFGTGGAESRPDAHLLSEISASSLPDFEENLHFKSITRSSCVTHHGTHMAIISKGTHVSPSGRQIAIEAFGRSDQIDLDIAELNHYVLKSRDEYELKKRRGIASFSDLDDPRRTARFNDIYFNALDRNETIVERPAEAIAALKDEMERMQRMMQPGRVSIRAK